ncbi:hypothetical protein FVR03_04265 [Pontibacter qinzhouensis]|uniref:DUF2490 domain-containing protein n=1 Tax=Pontibacter qinzhouensis TaxID=2603253 RepID=A0A5C8KEK9_9BACT|nr:DUF2490 domain-containing protein [Pontibacter qinzhouensis]TXK50874.1 hypothetical protein FVR03_04265 [Pontibacter qinzhouensis]
MKNLFQKQHGTSSAKGLRSLYKGCTLLAGLLLLSVVPGVVAAQSKITAATALWPEVQLNYGVGEDGILFFQNQYRINTDSRFNDLAASGPFSGFERAQLTLGYEHTFTDHWRGGALFRYAFENYPKTQFYTAFLRHNGNIGSLFFNKQGMFEYVNQEEQDAFGRYSFLAELGKRFPVGNRFLTPALSYELLLRREFGKSTSTAEERTIDRTRLRFELTYELTENLRLSPFVMRQTDYYFVLVPPKYDENDRLIEDGYTTKRNRISPVIGLEIKFNLNTPVNTASFTY